MRLYIDILFAVALTASTLALIAILVISVYGLWSAMQDATKSGKREK